MNAGKVVPQNLAAERSLLGFFLDDGTKFNEIGRSVEAADFWLPTHARVFEALLDLSELGEPIGVVSVQERCQLRGHAVSATDLTGMVEDAAPSIVHVKNYAKVIWQAARKRQVLARIQQVEQQLYDGVDIGNIADTLNEAAAILKESHDCRPAQRLIMVNLAEVERENISWLWQGRVPVGKLTLCGGDPGIGKSFLSLAIASAVTRATCLPGGNELPAPANVLILSAEDGLTDTIKPRLEGLGADCGRVTALRAVRDARGRSRAVSLRDIEALELALKDKKPALTIIDPIAAYLPGVDSHKSTEVRALLAPLAELAELHRTAVLIIAHLNKSEQSKILYRVVGTIDFIAACRSVLFVGEHPEDSNLRVVVHAKTNVGPRARSVMYSLDGDAFTWKGESDLTADQVLATPANSDEKSQLEEAKDFLRTILKDSPVASGEIAKQSRQAGIAERTLWRAKSALRVKADKRGEEGAWRWWLPC